VARFTLGESDENILNKKWKHRNIRLKWISSCWAWHKTQW